MLLEKCGFVTIGIRDVRMHLAMFLTQTAPLLLDYFDLINLLL